ncbi:MAG: DUF4339 domain-containing protein, partial [Planctomycetes bacterium]|nr:DUF4339 domain-containing protein [Planctomycetota bacterium]
MKNISVKCDACGAEFMVPSSLAGQKARCSCGASLSIPKSDETDDDKTPESEEKKETPQTETSLESARWYVSESGQSKGPLSFEELKNRVVHGQLLPQDQVYAEPLGGWKPIAEIDALKPGKQKQKDAWYVSIKGQRYGPYKTEYVKELIQKGQITPKTSVWSKELGDWRTIRQVGRFQQTLKELEASKNIEEMWYWMRKGKREGPYSLENLLKAVRKGKIKADDRIWSNKLDGWKDAASIPELSEALDEVPSASPAASGELWYYRHNGEVEGPLEFNELCQLVERKQVVAGDTVFNKNLGAWKDIRDVPELEKSIAAAEAGLGKADEESEHWYFRMEGQERGPVTERYLAELLAKRKLGPDDKIQGPDSDQWRPIRNIPAIARYADFSAPSTTQKPDEQPTGTVTGTIIGRGRKESDRWKKIGIGLVILLVLGSGGLFLITSLKNRGNGGNGTNGGFQTSTKPEQFIKQWLTFFLPELEGGAAGQQQEIGRKLKLFYNGNFMDAFGRDVRARLRNHLM